MMDVDGEMVDSLRERHDKYDAIVAGFAGALEGALDGRVDPMELVRVFLETSGEVARMAVASGRDVDVAVAAGRLVEMSGRIEVVLDVLSADLDVPDPRGPPWHVGYA